MNPERTDAWLSKLPQVATDIKVHLQENIETFAYGRINCDDETIRIDVIKKSSHLKQFPSILQTVSFELKDILKLSFSIDEQRFSFLGNSLQWLKDLPKSRKNSVFVLCSEKGRAIDVSNGWTEFDKNKVYVREVVRVTHRGCEIESHERLLSEVILILVNNGREPTLCTRSA